MSGKRPFNGKIVDIAKAVAAANLDAGQSDPSIANAPSGIVIVVSQANTLRFVNTLFTAERKGGNCATRKKNRNSRKSGQTGSIDQDEAGR